MSAKLAPLMSSGRQDWCTPENVLERVRLMDPAGRIALDVATADDNPCKADRFFTEKTDGLGSVWSIEDGRTIWMNPPYGRALNVWASRWAGAVMSGLCDNAHAIALTPSRTDTRWFRLMLGACDAVCLVKGRLTFKGAPAPAPFPSAVFYAGYDISAFASAFRSLGWVVRP